MALDQIRRGSNLTRVLISRNMITSTRIISSSITKVTWQQRVELTTLTPKVLTISNYYRRTIAHNSLLVFAKGEKFFWAENLWPAANDGGQRMDSSRYWNTVRSREDFERTRDLWDTGRMEVTDYAPGSYVYARGNATRAYQPSKMERFTREVASRLGTMSWSSLIAFELPIRIIKRSGCFTVLGSRWLRLPEREEMLVGGNCVLECLYIYL